MAIMIPEKPRDFDPASLEGCMFNALEQLPDDYYVFHSFRRTVVDQNVLHEHEIDFVVLNQRLGLLCLEAKAGRIRYENGKWRYANGVPMDHEGPFNQAAQNKWGLMSEIRKRPSLAPILNSCKFLHGVWFPSITKNDLKAIQLPQDAAAQLILTKESLDSPQIDIDRIFGIEVRVDNQLINTNLNAQEFNKLLYEFLCPQFDIFHSVSTENDLRRMVFHRFLREQAGILNFLSEQKTAVINGAAGTGKTMIAVEKAQRHAAVGEKVLFLCYNSELNKYLKDNFAHENIAYYTISAFACSQCKTDRPNYKQLQNRLDEYYMAQNFPFQHIIVDEGQDFGSEQIEEADILNRLMDIVNDDNSVNRTFYVFYDKLQLIQARQIPAFIEQADCRLKLYRNCRNTINIAKTSIKPINSEEPKLIEGCVSGKPAGISYCNTPEEVCDRLNMIIGELREAEEIKDIVILTSKTEENSVLHGKIVEGIYTWERHRYHFSTCRKFKGLEADAIVLIDIDRQLFTPDNKLLFYVGASRARLRLELITTLSQDDCISVLTDPDINQNPRIRDPQRDFATFLFARRYNPQQN